MATLKDIYDIIKELRNLAKEIQNQEVSALVADIQDKYFDLKEELESIKDENKELKEKLSQKEDIVLNEFGFYVKKSENSKHVFCPYCYNKDDQLCLLERDNNEFYCKNCNQYFINRG
jgi:hypothetical protein